MKQQHAMQKPTGSRGWSLMPWSESPFDDLERLWSKPFAGWRHEGRFMPTLDVVEKKGKLMVNAELPGVAKEDVSVELDNGNLVIKGEKRHEEETEDEGFYRRECSYGSFYRSLPLSFEAKPESVKAKFKDGVLKVEIPMPKGAQKSTAKQVQIS
jgi:HSP20 family protein